jgi:DNA methylase
MEGPGALGAGPAGPGEPSPPGTGQDGAVGTRGTCCFAMSARTRSPCGERISGRPSRRSSLRTHGGLVEPLCVAERRVELALCISDGGLQQHAVAELQHIGEDPLLDLTDCGDIVVDPFLGSGSTLIAADKTGRVCRGVELDPLYVDVIVRRFEAATGNQAALVETGETFEALATQGAGTGVALRPAPAVADVADEEREAATGQARGCLHCGGQRSPRSPRKST